MNLEYTVSIQILLEELNVKREENDRIDYSQAINSIKLYEKNRLYTSETLVVGWLSDVIQVNKKYSNVTFLCPRDRYAEENEDLENIIVLKTNHSVEHIFNRLLDVMDQLRKWRLQMSYCILENKGLQNLLDLSEPILKNHIDIMDSTFKLLAYTKGIEIDNEATRLLIKNGYHAAETISRFKELRRIEEYEKMDSTVVTTDRELCEYDTVKRIFHLNGNVHLYVVMHCNHREATTGTLMLFQFLLECVRSYIDKNEINPETFAESQRYIHELLERKITTMDEAVNRATYASVPFQKRFVIFLISFQDSFNIPLENLVMILSKYMGSAYVLSFNRSIVILRHLTDRDKLDEIKERVEMIAASHMMDIPCIIGVSNVFDNLWQVNAAHEQAGCAVEYGWHTLRGIPVDERPPVKIYEFEECFLTLVVAKSFNHSPELFGTCFMVDAIDRLIDYDEKHNTRMLETLDEYLKCDKKATAVCNILHMHRNTVLYHIDRIESIIGESLSDRIVCLKLQIGLMMRESNMHAMLTGNNVGVK